MWSRQPARKKNFQQMRGKKKQKKNWAPKVVFCISPRRTCVYNKSSKGEKNISPHMISTWCVTMEQHPPHKHTYREKTSLANAA